MGHLFFRIKSAFLSLRRAAQGMGVLNVPVELDERGNVAEGDCDHQSGGVGHPEPSQREDKTVNGGGPEKEEKGAGDAAEADNKGKGFFQPPGGNLQPSPY